MKNFIKENLVLVIGLALPVLLILLFYMVTVLPKSMGIPPQYEMLFTTVKYAYQNQPDYLLYFSVKNQQLVVEAQKNEDKIKHNSSTRLMAYDGETETVREIAIDVSKFTDGAEVVLDETKDMTIDTTATSPDGYKLEGPNHSGSGLLGGVFSGGYRNGGYQLKKDNIGYKLPDYQPDYDYNQLQFIGWVIKK